MRPRRQIANIYQIRLHRRAIRFRENAVVSLLFTLALLRDLKDADRSATQDDAWIGAVIVNQQDVEWSPSSALVGGNEAPS